MSELPNHRVHVRFICRRGHEPHLLCIAVDRGLPPELRCDQLHATGPGSGCPTPSDLEVRVCRELDNDLEKWKRQGHVVIHLN